MLRPCRALETRIGVRSIHRVITFPTGRIQIGADSLLLESDVLESQPGKLTYAEADKRFLEVWRLRRHSYLIRLQLS